MIRTVLQPLSRMLSPDDRKKGVGLLMLLTLSALLDFAGLATLLPVIYLFADPQRLESSALFQNIYATFGFKTITAFYAALLGAMVVFTVAKNMVAQRITRMKARYVFRVGSSFSVRLLEHHAAMPWLSFIQSDYTKELNRITNYPVAFANNIILPLGTILSEGLLMTFLIVSVIVFDVRVFLFLLLILSPVILVYVFQRRKLKQNSLTLKEKYSASLKYGNQVIEGFPEIRTSGKFSYFKERFGDMSRHFGASLANEHSAQARTSRITELIAVCTLCSLILYAVLFEQNLRATLVTLGLYAAVSFRMLPSFNRILNALLQIRTHEHLFHELRALQKPITTPTTGNDISNFQRSISLENISFRYPDRETLLHNISFTVEKGEKIALVGKSGSGKTTLLLIIGRLLDSDTGTMMLDHTDISSASEQSVRRLFAYVPQNPYLLDASLQENVAFGIPATAIDTLRIRRILDELQLTSLVDSLPEGLDTRVGEKGVRLSGGQRQRIALARALYSEAEILLLDEITNQLDADTEKEVVAALEKIVQQNKTVIMITHHQNLLPYFDRVLTLHAGNLVAEHATR